MHSPVRKKWLLSLFLLCVTASASETMYVQATKATVRDKPSGNSKVVATFKRGQQVEVLKKQGIWFEVQDGKARGWISRLFLSPHEPVGAAELNSTLPNSLEKESRRRPASYAVSASTRGLTASERVRQGRELYRSNFKALEKLENRITPDAKTLEAFLSEGGLK